MPKNPTKEQLDKMIAEAETAITSWVKYLETLVEKRSAIQSNIGTTPPGPHPKNPPGV